MSYVPPIPSEYDVKDNLDSQKNSGPNPQIPPAAFIRGSFEYELGRAKPCPDDHTDKKEGYYDFSQNYW
jgi:hypothetical protein